MNSLSTDTREVLTCFLYMNLLFLVLLPVPQCLIPRCTCSVTPAGAVGIYKHSWCFSASKLSDLPSPRTSPQPTEKTHSLPQNTTHNPDSWCGLIRLSGLQAKQGFVSTNYKHSVFPSGVLEICQCGRATETAYTPWWVKAKWPKTLIHY